MSNRVRGAVIILVAGVWTANYVAPIFVKGYVPSPEVHFVFLTVLAVLGLGYQRRTGEHRPPDDPPETTAGGPSAPADQVNGAGTSQDRIYPAEHRAPLLSQLTDRPYDGEEADHDRHSEPPDRGR